MGKRRLSAVALLRLAKNTNESKINANISRIYCVIRATYTFMAPRCLGRFRPGNWLGVCARLLLSLDQREKNDLKKNDRKSTSAKTSSLLLRTNVAIPRV